MRNAYELSDERWQSVAKVKAIIRLVYTLLFTMQIDSQLVATTNWPNVVKTKIADRQMTYSVVDVVLSSRFGEQSDEENISGDDDQWDGKTRWDHLPKVKVRTKQLGVIGSKLHNHTQKELTSYFPFPSDQQLVAMVCDLIMLTLALPWLCAAGYKDDIDNAKELFKSAFVDEATCLFWSPEPDTPPNDDNVDVQVCDDDNVFDMVNIGSPGQNIESGASTALNMVMPGDLANEAFKEWISLKVDRSAWLLNEQNKIDKNKVCAGN